MSVEMSKKEKDIMRLLKSECHLASVNYNVQMKRFIHSVSPAGVPVFNVDETYEKIRLAARVISGVRNLADVFAISSRTFGQRAAMKFASTTGCSATSSSRWTPGSLTNHQTKQFKEPSLILVADPYADYKAIKEASYANIPVIALCNSHNNLKYVDIAIPCNNSSTFSISMVFWMIAREVNILRGKIDASDDEWSEVMVDLFYFKDIEDVAPAADDTQSNADAPETNQEEDDNWNETNN